MSEAVVAQVGSYAVAVESGKTYYWCRCGRSQKQPFCDGAHAGTGFNPIAYVAEDNETIYFCGCKHSQAMPFCDGSHSRLVEVTEGPGTHRLVAITDSPLPGQD
ncbi:MAG TPA: CDGSH iron-sulfur domain-containing protein [Rhodocyclaceae bacterium]|nr:CDGSH iron-sulfur domain-containing protein [Rhodocyclaceae bacterium]